MLCQSVTSFLLACRDYTRYVENTDEELVGSDSLSDGQVFAKVSALCTQSSLLDKGAL